MSSDTKMDTDTEIVDYKYNKAKNCDDISYLARKIREKEAFSQEDLKVIFFFTQLIYFIKMCYLYYKFAGINVLINLAIT